MLAATRTPGRYTLPASDDEWFDTPFAGIRGRVLAVDGGKGIATLFLRAEPGAVYPRTDHHGAEECYVLRGTVVIDGRTLRAGDFHHADDGSTHGEITTVEGADVLIVGAIEDDLPGLLRREAPEWRSLFSTLLRTRRAARKPRASIGYPHCSTGATNSRCRASAMPGVDCTMEATSV